MCKKMKAAVKAFLPTVGVEATEENIQKATTIINKCWLLFSPERLTQFLKAVTLEDIMNYITVGHKNTEFEDKLIASCGGLVDRSSIQMVLPKRCPITGKIQAQVKASSG